MGRPKAMLVLGGETMLERQLRLLGAVCRSVAVLGPPQNFSGLQGPVFPDDLPGRGPLGGISTGLGRMRTEYGFFLGCDLPFMEVRFLKFLACRAIETRADITVPESHDRDFEPLCAVYGRRALRAVRASLQAGENKTRAFYRRVRCDVVPWREIARAGFSPRIFANMNTPQDYQAAKRQASEW
ncbi:MAG: molybdenum cofactor guanylyltransferase [Acidobacteria bacterium]|nr:molybdenum cofactor guanylyltransferase [Acidobacteriota bacterium]